MPGTGHASAGYGYKTGKPAWKHRKGPYNSRGNTPRILWALLSIRAFSSLFGVQMPSLHRIQMLAQASLTESGSGAPL